MGCVGVRKMHRHGTRDGGHAVIDRGKEGTQDREELECVAEQAAVGVGIEQAVVRVGGIIMDRYDGADVDSRVFRIQTESRAYIAAASAGRAPPARLSRPRRRKARALAQQEAAPERPRPSV
jgi:hypothetical protein